MSKFNLNENISKALIDNLCQTYQIGQLKSTSQLASCSGGLLHRVYRFETTKDQFVLKVLNPDVITRQHRGERYRITERIAREIAKYHIPVISALLHDDDCLFTDGNETMMLFPYVQGKTLEQKAIKSHHVKTIADTLSQIHQANIKIDHAPEADLPNIDSLKNKIQETKIKSANDDIKNKLNMLLPEIDIIAEKCHRYRFILQNNSVISHRDLDAKNVLWDTNNQHYIIDWESAGLINKTKDVLATAMYWSLDDQFKVNIPHLSTFISTYQQTLGIIHDDEIEAGLYGLLGDWLTWLDFNLSRVLNNLEINEEFLLGDNEVKKTSTALPFFHSQFPLIIKTIQEDLC